MVLSGEIYLVVPGWRYWETKTRSRTKKLPRKKASENTHRASLRSIEYSLWCMMASVIVHIVPHNVLLHRLVHIIHIIALEIIVTFVRHDSRGNGLITAHCRVERLKRTTRERNGADQLGQNHRCRDRTGTCNWPTVLLRTGGKRFGMDHCVVLVSETLHVHSLD